MCLALFGGQSGDAAQFIAHGLLTISRRLGELIDGLPHGFLTLGRQLVQAVIQRLERLLLLGWKRVESLEPFLQLLPLRRWQPVERLLLLVRRQSFELVDGRFFLSLPNLAAGSMRCSSWTAPRATLRQGGGAQRQTKSQSSNRQSGTAGEHRIRLDLLGRSRLRAGNIHADLLEHIHVVEGVLHLLLDAHSRLIHGRGFVGVVIVFQQQSEE